MFVYLIQNRVNGKRYVGKTVYTLNHRWANHQVEVRRGSKNPLHSAIRKYGIAAFSISLLAVSKTAEGLNALEREYIKNLETHTSLGKGYNATWGGDGTESGERSPAFGTKRTPEVRKRLSETKTGHQNPSYRERGLSHWNRGRVRSEETKAKLRAARLGQTCPMKGRHHSEQTKAKIRAARARQSPPSPEARMKMSEAGKKGMAIRLGRW